MNIAACLPACLFLVISVTAGSAIAQTVFVDASSGAGLNNGTSWSDAFTDLQPGIDKGILMGWPVLVAEGTYRPTTKRFPAGTSDSRAFAFVIRGNASLAEIHGGFLGFGGGGLG